MASGVGLPGKEGELLAASSGEVWYMLLQQASESGHGKAAAFLCRAVAKCRLVTRAMFVTEGVVCDTPTTLEAHVTLPPLSFRGLTGPNIWPGGHSLHLKAKLAANSLPSAGRLPFLALSQPTAGMTAGPPALWSWQMKSMD